MSETRPSGPRSGDRTADLPSETSGAGESRTRGALVVAAIFTAITLGALDQFVVVTALPNIATSLGAANGVAFVVSAFLISAAVGILVFGRLTLMFSHRNVLLAGLATFIAGSALAGLSQNLGELIAFRTFQGFSGDSFIVVGFAICADLFPPKARARITGLFTGTFVIATIVGPFVGSSIVDHASWRWVFYVNIPVAVLAALISATVLKGGSRGQEKGFDIPGTALLVGWVSTITFALVQTAEGGWAWTDPRVIVSLLAGLSLLLGFLAWEPRAEHPLIPVSLFRSRAVSASAAVSFFRGVGLFSIYTFVAVYVGLVLDQGGANAADNVRNVLYFLVIPAVVGAGLGSQLVIRTGYRPVMLAGLGLGLIGGLGLTQISASTPLWTLAYGFLPIGGLALPLMPIGFGVGLTFPVTILAAQFAVPRRETGAVTSIIEFTQTIGGAMGVSVLASFQQWRLGQLAPNPGAGCTSANSCATLASAFQHAAVTSLQEVFGLVAALILVSLVASWWITGHIPSGGGEPVPVAEEAPLGAPAESGSG